MNKTLKQLLKWFAGHMWAALVGAIISAAGIGFLALKYFRVFIGQSKILLSSTTSLGVLLIVGLLFLILGYLRGKPKTKPKLNKLIIDEFIQIGPYKWRTKVYKNKTFSVDFSPYCAKHDMKLVESWPLNICPMHHDCDCQLHSDKTIFAHEQAESMIEAELRKQDYV